MTHLLLDISTEAVNWARAQFALTAIYHWLFVPLTLGLAVIMGICETRWYPRHLLAHYGTILAEALRHQLCHGCGHRHHP